MKYISWCVTRCTCCLRRLSWPNVWPATLKSQVDGGRSAGKHCLVIMMDTEEEILSGQFGLLPTKKLFFVSLSRKSLTYSKCAERCWPCVGKHRSATFMSTNLKDVYGAKAYRGPEGDPAAYFQVYSCPISEKKRVRQKTCFKIASSESEEANIALAEKWVRTILWLVKEPEKNVSSLEGKIWWLRSHVKSNIWRVFFCLSE